MSEGEKNRPSISIIIVNSDGTPETLKCLESIFRYPPCDTFEVILVDNCSNISCLPLVESRYPKVCTFSSPRKQGFSKNYNIGIHASRGEIIMILNNDTLIHSGSLDKLVGQLRTHPEYGIVGPKLLDSMGKIQSVCVRALITPISYILTLFVLDLATPSGKLWDQHRRWVINRKGSGPVPCISGACMLLRREVLDEIGLLDEGYDFYYEDVEWCHRAQRHGYQVAYVAEAEITHLGDQSLSKVKEWAKRSEYQSAIRYFRQYHDPTHTKLWLLWLATVMSYFLRSCIYWCIERVTGSSTHAEAYLNLTKWITHQAPKLGKEKRTTLSI